MSKRMWRRRVRRRAIGVIGVVGVLMLCAVVADAVGFLEPFAASASWNTSPPLTATLDGVTLAAPHTRYLTLDAFTLTLTNQSSAPIYLPVTYLGGLLEGGYVPVTDGPASYGCLPIETEVREAQGWRSLGSGCHTQHDCPSGTAQASPPLGVLVIKPGQSAVFPIYDGEALYPPWSPGVYRFRVLFTQTPFQAVVRSYLRTFQAMSHAVVLTSGPVTLTGAWWIPFWYHQRWPCRVAD